MLTTSGEEGRRLGPWRNGGPHFPAPPTAVTAETTPVCGSDSAPVTLKRAPRSLSGTSSASIRDRSPANRGMQGRGTDRHRRESFTPAGRGLPSEVLHPRRFRAKRGRPARAVQALSYFPKTTVRIAGVHHLDVTELLGDCARRPNHKCASPSITSRRAGWPPGSTIKRTACNGDEAVRPAARRRG